MSPEQTAKPVHAKAANEDVEAARQRLYAKYRILDLVDEMKKLAEERQQLVGKRSAAGVPDQERKKINQRWAYIAMRNEHLRTERKTLSEQLKPAQKAAS